MALAGADELTERVEFAKKALGARLADVELNLLVHFVRVTDDRKAALEEARERVPDLSADELGRIPTVLAGTAEHIADQLLEYREGLGISHYTVIEDDLDRLAPVLGRLRGR